MSKNQDPFRDPSGWMLFLGLSALLGGLVLLLLLPANSLGF